MIINPVQKGDEHMTNLQQPITEPVSPGPETLEQAVANLLRFKFDPTKPLTLLTSISAYEFHLWDQFGIRRVEDNIHINITRFNLDKLVGNRANTLMYFLTRNQIESNHTQVEEIFRGKFSIQAVIPIPEELAKSHPCEHLCEGDYAQDIRV